MKNKVAQEEVVLVEQPRAFKKHRGFLHEFYLSGYIDSPENYISWFDEIRNTTALDEVRVYINSGGGNLDTALQFMRVLTECEATTTASVEGSCMSAATMIFLSCDNFEITPHSLWMFHNYAGGIVGKGGEMYDQAVFERKWSEGLLNEIYAGFLSTEEINSLLANRDIWMDSNEVLARCNELLALREGANPAE